jgi:hypothetical protein
MLPPAGRKTGLVFIATLSKLLTIVSEGKGACNDSEENGEAANGLNQSCPIVTDCLDP